MDYRYHTSGTWCRVGSAALGTCTCEERSASSGLLGIGTLGNIATTRAEGPMGSRTLEGEQMGAGSLGRFTASWKTVGARPSRTGRTLDTGTLEIRFLHEKTEEIGLRKCL